MKKFRLPKGAKAAIRSWLDLAETDKPDDCPFMTTSTRCQDVCMKAFLRTQSAGSGCPCSKYTLGYVIRRAKEIIR